MVLAVRPVPAELPHIAKLARCNFSSSIRQDDLDAPVQLAILSRVVGGNWISFAVPTDRDTLTGHTEVLQGTAYRIGAAFGQILVMRGRAGAAGETFNEH